MDNLKDNYANRSKKRLISATALAGFEAPIFTSTGGGEFVRGMVFRDTNPESIRKICTNIRKIRRTVNGVSCPVPERIYLRILQVASEFVRVIWIEDPCGLDIRIPISDASECVMNRMWVVSLTEPIKLLGFAESDLSQKQLSCRDKNYEIIKPLIDLGEDIFDASKRWTVIKRICESKKLRPNEIYRLMRRYFQGGMQKNALAGRWFTRTVSGNRVDGSNKTRMAKAGRLRLDGYPTFRMNFADVNKVVAGAVKYFHTPQGGVWKRAWLLTLCDYYIEVDFSSSVSLDEQLEKYKPDTYPSLVQFMYHARHDTRILALIKKRHGERQFNLKNRKLNERTETKATGPGSHFQVDPTPFDVVIVHRVTRRPIGRIILYLVVDVFTHMIVGYFVHVGNPGFDPASIALLSAAENKVALCRRFGVEISEEEWPVACLCGRLLADSELSSLRAHALVQEDLMKLTIVPAYRADLKGLVEALLGAAAKKARHLPGHTCGPRKRAEISPDAMAVLDYYEVNQIVISWIRQANRRVIKNYKLTQEMIADGVVPTPLNLWRWGIPNLGGLRCQWPMEKLKRIILPTGKGHITRRGLEFNGLVYEPNGPVLPEFESWCVQRTERNTWPEKITYSPIDLNELWLHFDGRLIPMHLSAESRVYIHWSFADLDGHKFEQSVGRAVAESVAIPALAALEGQQNKIVQEAAAKTEQARGTVAQRRREKIDKPAERADQQKIIKAAKVPRTAKPALTGNPIISEEEAEIIANLKH